MFQHKIVVKTDSNLMYLFCTIRLDKNSMPEPELSFVALSGKMKTAYFEKMSPRGDAWIYREF